MKQNNDLETHKNPTIAEAMASEKGEQVFREIMNRQVGDSSIENLAQEMAEEGIHPDVISDELKSRGISRVAADEIANASAAKYRSESRTREGKAHITIGLGLFAVGLVLTVFLHVSIYSIALLICGVVVFIRGLYKQTRR